LFPWAFFSLYCPGASGTSSSARRRWQQEIISQLSK
jgi:hypothetical protein